MKFLTASTGFVLLLALACTPKNDTIETAQVDPGKKVPDSVINPAKDGTATTHTQENPKFPLPQPALQLLEKEYPGWREPVLLEEAARKLARNEQGPLTVRADLNGDNLQDFALQIRHQKQVVVVALLQDSVNWQLHELKKDILFNDRSAYKSLYYIYLTKAGARLYDYETRQHITTLHDAVSVGIDNSATTYMYEDKGFKAYETED